MRAIWLLALPLLASACLSGDDGDAVIDDPGDAAWLAGDGKSDGASAVNIAETHLAFDLAAHTATATLKLEKNGSVSLAAGGLAITHVRDDRGNRRFKMVGDQLRVANVRGELQIEYAFTGHDNADGLLPGGSTVVWPYFCGNLFPCHTAPADGTRFTLALDGVPAGERAIFPATIAADAPPYMIAWAVGDYISVQLGTTTAGTRVAFHALPGGKTAAAEGTKHLVGVFDWYEQHVGPYLFGKDVAAVSVVWGEGLYGGMEHHPYWHVAKDAMNDEETQAHEAAHGWFGDGIRLRCWEDFVLSEGTVSYLAARALGQVAGPAKEAEVWNSYRGRLQAAINAPGTPAWPTGCNQVDILKDKLFSDKPYMQGAYFYKDVAAAVGAEVLDGVIARFYVAHRGGVAGMQDMIDAIKHDTGFDPSPLVASRLRR
jgi:aminopeptidase N